MGLGTQVNCLRGLPCLLPVNCLRGSEDPIQMAPNIPKFSPSTDGLTPLVLAIVNHQSSWTKLSWERHLFAPHYYLCGQSCQLVSLQFFTKSNNMPLRVSDFPPQKENAFVKLFWPKVFFISYSFSSFSNQFVEFLSFKLHEVFAANQSCFSCILYDSWYLLGCSLIWSFLCHYIWRRKTKRTKPALCQFECPVCFERFFLSTTFDGCPSHRKSKK